MTAPGPGVRARVGGRGKQDPPYHLLVGQYIRAVMDGRPPAAVCRYKFGLTQSQWEDRRRVLSRDGWLPAGDPVQDGLAKGAYSQEWLDLALEMYGEQLERVEAARVGALLVERLGASRRAAREEAAAVRVEQRDQQRRARQRALALAAVAEQANLVFDIIG